MKRKRLPYYSRLNVAAGALRRAAHRRGHGIHSPFAFDFVRRVIGQACRYYAYDDLKITGSGQKLSRLLFRLGLFFAPDEILTRGEVIKTMLHALEYGARQAGKPVPGRQLYVAAPGEMFDDSKVNAIASREGIIVWLAVDIPSGQRAQVARQAAAQSHGMLFQGAGVSIYVGFRRLPSQRFGVWI